jgi:protein deglycase
MESIPRVLCLVADGFEELETIAPVDLLRRAGVEVVLAALDDLDVVGRNGIRITADKRLVDVVDDAFNLLLLPGGPAVARMRADGRPASWVARFGSSGRIVAAICAAPLLVHDAGLLVGRRYTAFPSARAEIGGGVDEPVVEDGFLITSRGAGTAVDFAFALVTRLCGPARSKAIAAEIQC